MSGKILKMISGRRLTQTPEMMQTKFDCAAQAVNSFGKSDQKVLRGSQTCVTHDADIPSLLFFNKGKETRKNVFLTEVSSDYKKFAKKYINTEFNV